MIWEPAVAAAVVAGTVALLSLAVNTITGGIREARSRRRDGFAKAFAACVAYEEFAYVVRRRRASDPEGERIRISTELRRVQEDIAFYSAWMRAESPRVWESYNTLVSQLSRSRVPRSERLGCLRRLIRTPA